MGFLCFGDSGDAVDKQREEAQRLKEKDRARINREIEKDIKRAREHRKKEHRILLLGCGQAGKSTFIKQMRIIHSEGYQDEEKNQMKLDIASNIAMSISVLIENSLFEATPQTKEDTDIQEAVERINTAFESTYNPNSGLLEPEPSVVLSLADDITLLWKSTPIQNAYANRHNFQLIDCARYFLNKVHEIMSPEYVPTNDDITQTRVKTEGIIEHEFQIAGNGPARGKIIMIDVGGQRNERRKWIHCFEDVMLLMFLTAVSEFDQVCEEDEVTNRMRESLHLFETVLDYVYFQNTNVILFLNKKDVLEEKLAAGKKISQYFEEFPGPDGDYDAAIEFFKTEFLAKNDDADDGDRQIFVHETCATDEQNIRVVDTVVQATILDEILRNAV